MCIQDKYREQSYKVSERSAAIILFLENKHYLSETTRVLIAKFITIALIKKIVQ